MLRVLVACEHSGAVREAFRARGHEAFSCDILDASDGSPFHIKGDALAVLHDGWDLMIAFPPCTALCVTGNRHYAGTKAHADALQFVQALMDAPIARIALENPVGVISSAIRPPDQYVHPWEFGHSVNKKTGLWLKNLPRLQPTHIVPRDEVVEFPSGKRMSRWYYETSLLPHKQRGHARSITFAGLAAAMAAQWSLPALV